MFTSPLDMRVLKDGRYQLLSPLVFVHRNMKIILLEDFIWDLASIPRFLWEEVGCPMDYAMESALHDVLYASGLFPREKADLLFYIALRSAGRYKNAVGKSISKVIHTGVRIGGSSHYMSDDVYEANQYVRLEII